MKGQGHAKAFLEEQILKQVEKHDFGNMKTANCSRQICFLSQKIVLCLYLDPCYRVEFYCFSDPSPEL